MLLKVVQVKKENLLQCFGVFFGMCWEVRGRSKRQGMHSKDHTAQSYLKLCFGYYNGHIVSGFASVTTATN